MFKTARTELSPSWVTKEEHGKSLELHYGTPREEYGKIGTTVGRSLA